MATIGDVIVSGVEGQQYVTASLVNNTGLQQVGTKMLFGDGRTFRYVIVPTGATTLVQGSLYQGAANTANHIGLTPTAAAVGATTVTVTLGATAAVANEYAFGYLHINQGTAGGGYYQILSHPAAASGGSLTLTLATPVLTAIPATAASIDLVHNKGWAPVIVPTTHTQSSLGVAMRPLAAGQGGWVQTGGPCSVLTQGTVVIGDPCKNSVSVAGAVAPYSGVAATTVAEYEVGIVMRVGGNGAWSLVDLHLDT